MCRVELPAFMQSHCNDSLTGAAENQTTANQFIPTRSHREEPDCPLLMNIAFIPWFPFLHSLVLPFTFPHLFLPVSFRQRESCGLRGAWGWGGGNVWPKVAFLVSRDTKMQKPTQLHCEPEDCVISIIHCSLFPRSILCPAPVPRFGRKCSLKASPPTAEAQRSQSATKILPHTIIAVPSLPCGCTCIFLNVRATHSEAFHVSVAANPNTPKASWRGNYSPLNAFRCTGTYKHTYAATHVGTDMRGNVTVCLDRPVTLPLKTSCGNFAEGPLRVLKQGGISLNKDGLQLNSIGTIPNMVLINL